jgi:hypothetical protein
VALDAGMLTGRRLGLEDLSIAEPQDIRSRCLSIRQRIFSQKAAKEDGNNQTQQFFGVHRE